MTATVYLVRHATPDWSRTDLRYDIPPGPPLTPAGEAEAAQLGDFLRTAGVARLYASPLERTRRTAALAAEVTGAPVDVAHEVAEWQHGESESAVLDRIRPFVHATLDESRAAPQAIVTHGGPIRLLLQEFGLDKAEVDFYRRQFDRDNPLPPAGVWRLQRDASGQIAKPELVFAPNGFTAYVPEVVYV